MNKEELLEIRTLKTFVKGVKEEGASEPCKYVQFNRQEAQILLDYIEYLQKRTNKAIDFINAWKDNETDLKVSMLDLLQIEVILKGEDNESN